MNMVQHLQEENQRLRAALGMTVAMPESLTLTPSQWRIMCVLLKRDRVPSETLHAIMSDRLDHAHTDPRWVSTMVYKLRKRLQPLGITISTQYGFGYYMPPESKRRLNAVVGER
jgi:DNA-binding response OmpR family regulator